MKVKHITINVSDLDKSIEFYKKIAALKVLKTIELENTKLAFLGDGENDTQIELLNIKGREVYSGKGLFICFNCDNIDKMHEIANCENLNPSPIQYPDDNTKYFYVYDPDGLSVQLRQF